MKLEIDCTQVVNANETFTNPMFFLGIVIAFFLAIGIVCYYVYQKHKKLNEF